MKTIVNAYFDRSFIEYVTADDTEWISYNSPTETRRAAVALLNKGYKVISSSENFMSLERDTRSKITKQG